MILDSNIIIYSVMPENYRIRDYLKDIESDLYVSVVSKIEVLGFHKLTNIEKALFENFFYSANILPIDNSIIEEAISIKQQLKISLGDSLIAATALVNHQKLFTNNEDDFDSIPDIEIITMKSILS